MISISKILPMRMKILEEEMNGENVLFEMQKKGRLTGEPESPVEYLFKEIMGDEIKKGEKIENIQPDFLHVSEKIVFEIDGKDYHSSKEQLESDEKRNKIYMLNGWQVIRITGKTTMKDTEALKSMLSTIIRNKLLRNNKVLYINESTTSDYYGFVQELWRARYPELFYI